MLATIIKRLYLSLIETGNVDYDVLPGDAAAKTLTCKAAAWTWPAAWEEIAATVGAVDVWICDVLLQNPSALVDYQVQLGTGLAAAEVSIADGFTLNAADLPTIVHQLNRPIRVVAATRLAGMAENAAAAANTIDVRVRYMTGL